MTTEVTAGTFRIGTVKAITLAMGSFKNIEVEIDGTVHTVTFGIGRRPDNGIGWPGVGETVCFASDDLPADKPAWGEHWVIDSKVIDDIVADVKEENTKKDELLADIEWAIGYQMDAMEEKGNWNAACWDDSDTQLVFRLVCHKLNVDAETGYDLDGDDDAPDGCTCHGCGECRACQAFDNVR